MRVRVVREAIIKVVRVRIIVVRVIAARYRSLLRRGLGSGIVSGAAGIAPVTHAHIPLLFLSSLRITLPLLSITSSSSS